MKLQYKIFTKAVGVLFFLLSAETFAAMALAFSHTAPTNNNHAIVTGQATEAAAKQLALSECKRLTGKSDCEVVLSSSKPGYGAMYAACVSEIECFYSLATGYSSNRSAHDRVLAACKRDYGVDSCHPWVDWHEPAKTASAMENKPQAATAAPRAQSSAATPASAAANTRADSTAKTSHAPFASDPASWDARELEKMCKGDAVVCRETGTNFHQGRNGAPKSAKAALRFYDVACGLEDMPACYLAASEYLVSPDLENRKKGASLLLSTCSKGFKEACQLLKKMGVTPPATAAANPRADSGTKTSAAPGNGKPKQPKAGSEGDHQYNEQNFVGLATGLIVGPEKTRDVKEGLRMLNLGCAEGMPLACATLGGIYFKGLNVAKDPEKSDSYYEKACFAGGLQYCEAQAMDYLDGEKRKVSPEKAMPLLEKGCQLGDGGLCAIAANIYGNGDGVRQDKQKAANLREKGCSQGEAKQCFFLGYAYQNGEGVPRDLAKGARLYDKSCSLNDPDGCYMLSAAFANGRGVENDDQKAFALLNKACKLGSAQACNTLKQIGR